MSRTTGAVLLLVLAVCAIYLPDVGHGFIRDDAGWVGYNDLSSWAHARELLQARAGLFRPAATLSFALERRVCGIDPLCYGITNFILLMVCTAGVVMLARALSLSTGAAIVAGALWVLNWHGISSAVLWISGRTALMLVMCAAFSAAAFMRGRWLLAALLAAGAMFSKEEGVLIPAALLGWAIVEAWTESRPLLTARNIGFAIASCVAGAVYYIARLHSGALTASSAPAFYRLDFSIARLLSNGPQYLDRSLTFAVSVLLLFYVVYRPPVGELVRRHRRLLWFAVVWWVFGFAITMFIPVRSSLYACAPSIGISIAAAAMLHDAWSLLRPPQQMRAIQAGLVLPFLLWPVYHLRNKDLVDATDVSARTITALRRVAHDHGANTIVVLKDDRSHRASIDTALGTGLQEAADLLVTPPLKVWMDPPPADAELGGIGAAPAHSDVTLRLTGGQLVEEP